MPIISDTMLRILDTADRAVKKVEQGRRRFDEITRDAEIVKARIADLGIDDPVLGDRVQSIYSTSQGLIRELFLDGDDTRYLAEEFARFKINQSKNAAGRERMKLFRAGTRKIDHFVPRPNRRQTTTTTTTVNRIETLTREAEDIAWLGEKGQKFHPNEGRCDGIPCEICRRLGTGEFAPKEEEGQSPTPSLTSGTTPDGFEDNDPFAKDNAGQ